MQSSRHYQSDAIEIRHAGAAAQPAPFRGCYIRDSRRKEQGSTGRRADERSKRSDKDYIPAAPSKSKKQLTPGSGKKKEVAKPSRLKLMIGEVLPVAVGKSHLSEAGNLASAIVEYEYG